MSYPTPAPPPPPTDVKTCDTTGDQVLRFILRGINALWVFACIVGALPLGIVWLIGTIAFTIWNSERRKKRYARNAAAIAQYQAYLHAQSSSIWNHPPQGWRPPHLHDPNAGPPG